MQTQRNETISCTVLEKKGEEKNINQTHINLFLIERKVKAREMHIKFSQLGLAMQLSTAIL